jgi:ankyrin repeat protein
VKTLCDKGATVDTRDKKKRTPFLDAAGRRNLNIGKTLKGNGADSNQVSGKNKWSALHEAADRNRVDVGRQLVNLMKGSGEV